MTLRQPRCIVVYAGTERRCTGRALRRDDAYACGRHGAIAIAVLRDSSFPETRRVLAFATWETVREAHRVLAAWRRTRRASAQRSASRSCSCPLLSEESPQDTPSFVDGIDERRDTAGA